MCRVYHQPGAAQRLLNHGLVQTAHGVESHLTGSASMFSGKRLGSVYFVILPSLSLSESLLNMIGQ